MEVSGQLHALAILLQGKNPWYPLDRRLGGPWSQSGCGGEEKNSWPLPGLEPLIIHPVAQCYMSYSSSWSETERCFITIVFQFCFRICHQEGVELNRTRQHLVCAGDVNTSAGNINSVKKNTEALLDASRKVGIEVSTERTKYMVMSKNLKIKIYKIILLHIVLYRCETWYHTQRE
jgi:hypothetical protein